MSTPYCPDQGDFIWIDFEPQSGREIMKYRPAIVLTDRAYNQRQGVCVVCPSSTKDKQYVYDVKVLIEAGKSSFIKADQIHSMDWRTRRAKFIGKAPDDVIEEVRETIAALLGIE